MNVWFVLSWHQWHQELRNPRPFQPCASSQTIAHACSNRVSISSWWPTSNAQLLHCFWSHAVQTNSFFFVVSACGIPKLRKGAIRLGQGVMRCNKHQGVQERGCICGTSSVSTHNCRCGRCFHAFWYDSKLLKFKFVFIHSAGNSCLQQAVIISQDMFFFVFLNKFYCQKLLRARNRCRGFVESCRTRSVVERTADLGFLGCLRVLFWSVVDSRS